MEDGLTELPIEAKLWNNTGLQSNMGDMKGTAKVIFDPNSPAEEFNIEWKPVNGNVESFACGGWWVSEVVKINDYDIDLNLTYSK